MRRYAASCFWWELLSLECRFLVMATSSTQCLLPWHVLGGSLSNSETITNYEAMFFSESDSVFDACIYDEEGFVTSSQRTVGIAVFCCLITVMLFILQLKRKPFLEDEESAKYWTSSNKQAAFGYVCEFIVVLGGMNGLLDDLTENKEIMEGGEIQNPYAYLKMRTFYETCEDVTSSTTKSSCRAQSLLSCRLRCSRAELCALNMVSHDIVC